MKYIIIILTALIIFIIGNTLYLKIVDKSGRADRISCHQKRIVFEKVFNDTLLKNVHNALISGNYVLKSEALKSIHMKSKLFEYVNLEEVDKLLKKTIAKHQKRSLKTDEIVTVDYFIYENDKGDPGKKTEKSKSYAGYLRFDIIYKGKKVYYVQVDFMDLKGADIDQSVKCAIDSILSA